MVHPKERGLLHQAMPHADCPLYLPIDIAIDNSDLVVDDAQHFAELSEATHKLGTIVCLDKVWLAPVSNYINVQEHSGPSAV